MLILDRQRYLSNINLTLFFLYDYVVNTLHTPVLKHAQRRTHSSFLVAIRTKCPLRILATNLRVCCYFVIGK